MQLKIVISEMPRAVKLGLNKGKKQVYAHKNRLALPAKKELEVIYNADKAVKSGKIRAGWGDGDCTNIDPCRPQFP